MTDPDETRPALAAAGVAMTMAGAALAATRSTTPARREDDDGSPQASAAAGDGGEPPPGGPSAPADPAAGPTGSGPDPAAHAELTRALENGAAAEQAATEAALAEARTRVEEAERAYHSAVARFTARRSAEEAEGLIESLYDWWTGRDEIEDTLLDRARDEVARTREAYRRAVADHLAIRLLTAAPAARATILADETRRVERRRSEVRNRAARDVERVILDDTDDRVRAQTLAARRAELETVSLQLEALDIARSRLPAGPGRPDTRDVLEALASSVRDTVEDRRRQPGAGEGAEWWEETEAHYRMREWLRDTERDLDVDRFVAVAETATVLDHRTGTPLEPDLRLKVAADRITWLSEYLESVSWRRHDPRTVKADELRQRLRSAYRALDFVGYGHVSMSEYLLATGRAIRERQSEINDWFLSDYLGLGDRLGVDTGSGWRTAWAAANVGVGTYGRVMGIGDENVEAVRARLATMNTDADVAVAALTLAAETPDPNRWPTGTRTLPDGGEIPASSLRDLLEDFGYIVTGPDGVKRYRMPAGDRAVTRATAVRLPGASWLDVVSARTAGEIVLSVAVPELAAVRAAAWVSRAGVTGARLASVARILVDQGLGFALDVGFQASREGWDRADLTAIAARSLVDGLAGHLSRGAGTRLARSGVRWAGASRALTEVLADPATRRTAESVVGELLGVPADAVTQLVVETAYRHEISSDDLWAALLGSAMNRGLVARLRSRSPDALYGRLVGRLESAVDTPAVALDRHLNQQAETAFDRALDGRPPTREAGDVVFEALRLGELTWEQLQRTYTLRGDELTPLMERVNERRNQLVGSIGTRARILARRRIAEHYDPLIAAAEGAEAERLRSEKRAELDKIADPATEIGVAARFTSEALDLAAASRAELVEHLLGGLEGPARDEARAELEALTDPALRDRALRHLEERYTAAVRRAAGDEIAPGSAGVTSDVDRSWSSEFLRRAAREVVLVEMTRGRADGEPGPTTARAFDVNEYLNVMTRIPSLVAARSDFADLVVATLQVGDRTVALTHADAVEANSLASAMLHMDRRQRDRFHRNLTDGLAGDALTRMQAMLQWARRSLEESERELAAHVTRQRERLPAGTADSEIELRARDELYGERMRRLDELGHAIDRATDPAERARLMSQWELVVNTALRDGIETYSDMANLEIIVIRMQSAGGKPDDLMRSEDFRLGSEVLAGITPQQIRAMLNDQILMLMHHVHTLHEGHESPAKAVRSFAKYTERALLALNLLGEFDPTVEGRYSELYRATRALMAHKNDPRRLVETLADLRGGKRGVSENLRWYLDQIELIPGMAGLTAEPPAGTAPEPWGRSLAAREWQRRRAAAAESADPTWASQVAAELSQARARLVEVEVELRRGRELLGFLPGDRARARQLVAEIDELTSRLHFLGRGRDDTWWGSGQFAGRHWGRLAADLRARQQELDGLRRRWSAAGEPVDEEAGRRVARLERERAGLLARCDVYGDELVRVAAGGDGGASVATPGGRR